MPPDDRDGHALSSVTEWLNNTWCSPSIREPLLVIENCQSRSVNEDTQRGKPSKKRKRAPEPVSTMSRTPSPKKRLLAGGLIESPVPHDDSTPRPHYPIADARTRSPPKSSSSTTSSRSRSPTKRKADFDIMYPRITFNEDKRAFADEDWKLPDCIRKAAVHIPKEMREDLERHPVARRNLDQVKWQEDHQYSLSQIQDFWAKVQSIEEAATLCSKEARSEDSWSDDVVLEIMRLALSWSGLGNNLMLVNLKSVAVDQPALLPVRNLQRVVSKRIDYGLCLQPDAEEEIMIENVLRNMSDELPSINQSAVPMLRKRALFCNLEIKKPYGNQDPAPQLGVWSVAGLTKLSNLAREPYKKMGEALMLEDAEVPVLPSWSVEGHRWQFYLARRCSSAETVILGPFWNFDTGSVVEIIFIVNALCEILRWGNTTFRQWLLTIISGLQTD